MHEYTLSLLQPELAEAKSREDLQKVLAGLRARGSWSMGGWTREDILGGIDENFIHHSDHYRRMVYGGDGVPSSSGIKNVRMRADEGTCELVFDGSREWEPDPHSYTVRVAFSNYGLIRKVKESWPDRARLLLADNVCVDCTCDAFRYYYRYGATKRGFSIVRENRPAKVRNKGQRGTVCKHLEHVLKYLGGHYAVMASAMKKHHQDLGEDMDIIARIDAALNESASPSVSRELAVNFDKLIEDCTRAGLAKTVNALRVARAQAQTEGMSGVPTNKVNSAEPTSVQRLVSESVGRRAKLWTDHHIDIHVKPGGDADAVAAHVNAHMDSLENSDTNDTIAQHRTDNVSDDHPFHRTYDSYHVVKPHTVLHVAFSSMDGHKESDVRSFVNGLRKSPVAKHIDGFSIQQHSHNVSAPEKHEVDGEPARRPLGA